MLAPEFNTRKGVFLLSKGREPVSFGSIGARGTCPDGTTTQGYGHDADEAADCGHELHFGNYLVYSKTVSSTTPSINIKMAGNDMHYISLSETDDTLSKLHIMYNDIKYTAYDDGLLWGERNPLTGAKITP